MKRNRSDEKHGMSRSAEYRIWAEMIQRCTNPKNCRYPNYGGRGISVCAEWRTSFAAFYGAVGERPAPHLQIDRINNEGNYEPSNCRWATPKEQAQNQRKTLRLTYGGRTQTAISWAAELGLSYEA